MRLITILRLTLLSLIACLCVTTHAAERCDTVIYSVSILANTSKGRFAPYMIGSWNGGRTVMSDEIVTTAEAVKHMSVKKRFDWGAGVELMAGYQRGAEFDKYNAETFAWHTSFMRPAPFTIQSLYADVHYRSLYLSAGMKEHQSKIVDSKLSSGDLVRSTNARPIPGITVGFVDFQNVPYTNGWLQVDGRIMYGKFTDNSFRRKQFNFYNEILAKDIYYTYKYYYFRTNPNVPFSAIFGMQSAGQFGGETLFYHRGQLRRTDHRGFKFKDIFKMFFPTRDNGNGYYEGNSLGSWSLRATYHIKNNNEIALYWEKYFEDGSGIGCRNGMDGLYGVQFSLSKRSILSSVLAEYLDFRNQSGPLHFAPGDHVDPSITTEATGGDNYYNNDTYGAYANYGMSIGSPMPVSPIYNQNGYPLYIYNRMRGFHIAAAGCPLSGISYKIMFGWQKGYAMGRVPMSHAKSDISAMLELGWQADRITEGLSVNCRFALDQGSLRGDNYGMALALRYTGSIINNKY